MSTAAEAAPAAAELLRQLLGPAAPGVAGAGVGVGVGGGVAPRPRARQELRTLELWRAVISECLGAFFYVLIVSGAAASVGSGTGIGASAAAPLAATAAAGLAAAALTTCFGHISGAHLNPAVTAALAVARRVTPLRALMFAVAQCGGGIAGAALLYGVTLPHQQAALMAVATLPTHLSPWERLALEFVLVFAVAFSHQAASEPARALGCGPAAAAGAVYAACSLVMMPALNPARALGPAFVMNKWEHHWVFWLGPMLGGIVAGLVYELVFSPHRNSRANKQSLDGDSSSIHSDEDPYDEVDKAPAPKLSAMGYNSLYRQGHGTAGAGPSLASPSGPDGLYAGSVATASLYSAPTSCKLERVESLYGGSKSLYAKSPPLTRANLNRSQSVYTKSPPCSNGEGLPRPGPLVPAQSLYPMRFGGHTTTAVNQNVQNAQHQQRNADSVYGVRGVSAGARAVEGGTVYSGGGPPPAGKIARPESLYGSVARRQDSADSAYSSYLSNTPGTRAAAYLKCGGGGSGAGGRPEARQSPQHPLLPPGASASVAYRNQRPSPSPQY
ncbi:Neurogenic protein big brain [Gryllus bimaculatus]|nr:Neurogenic protein big brain [Gryllus bimaculatus]